MIALILIFFTKLPCPWKTKLIYHHIWKYFLDSIISKKITVTQFRYSYFPIVKKYFQLFLNNITLKTSEIIFLSNSLINESYVIP